MKVAAAVLCDYAEVREGLLTIVSAGVTRLWRAQMPAPLGLFLALMIEVEGADRPFPHEITVVVTAPSGKEIARAGGGFQVGQGPDTDPDETSLVPMPIDLRQAGIEEFGWYSFAIAIDSQPAHTMRAKVAHPPVPGGAPATFGNRGTKPN